MAVFSGPEDEVAGLNWMKNKLLTSRDSIGKKSEDMRSTINNLIKEITQRINQLKVDASLPLDDWHDNLWERFIFCIDNVWISEASENFSPTYTEGEWSFVNSEKLEIGYSDEIKYTYIPRGGGSAKHYYHNFPPNLLYMHLV